MAQKNKNYYLSVMEGYKTVFQKMVFDAKEAKRLYEELSEKYPKPQYLVFKEYH
jgi:hypothetical protein